MTTPYSGRKVVLNVLAAFAGSGAGLVSLALCMHLLGVEGVRVRGILAFAATVVGTAALLAEAGFANAHVKRVSEGQDLARCVGTFLVIRLVQAALLVLAGLPFVVWPSLFAWVGGAAASRAERMALLATLAATALNQIADVWRQTYAARREVIHQRFPVVLGNWLQVPAAVAACTFVPVGDMTAAWWAAAGLVTPATALAYYLLWTRPLPMARPTRQMLSHYWRFAAPMTVSSAFLSVQLHLDKWFLKWWAGYEAVGLYDLCQKVVRVFDRQILAQMGNLVLSKMSELSARGRRADVGALAHLAERYLAFAAAPPVAVMAAASAPALAVLYGAPAAAGAGVFAVLALCGLVGALNRPYVQVIAGMDRPRYFAVFGGAMAALDVALNVLFIPEAVGGVPMLGLGALGAALSTLAVGLVGTVLNRRAAAALAGMPPVFAAWPKHAAAALAAAAACAGTARLPWEAWCAALAAAAPALPRPVFAPAPWALSAGAAAALAAYGAIVLLTRAARAEDVRFAREALSPRGLAADALAALRERRT